MAKRMFASLLCPAEQVTEEQLTTDINLAAIGRSIAALNRRRFLSSMAITGAGFAAAGFGTATSAEAQAAAPSVADVLNFALNLEFLEASLYASVTGMALPTGSAVTGAPTALALDAQTMATAVNLYTDETAHIAVLQSAISALSGTAITPPPINLSAGGPITTQAQFLAVARQFTAVGNSAYAGSAQYLVSQTEVLTTAGQILGAEAQHLGAVNYLCCLQGVMSPAVDAMDYPPVPPNTFFTISPTTETSGPALGPLRDTSQVLGIVYGVSTAATTNPTVGVTSGGFFPKGVNGAIVST